MKIPFGLQTHDQRMASPQSVPNGLGCGCVCAGCGQPLIARQGAIKVWHFAHASGSDCAHAVESAIHKMAKQLILDRREIYVPGYVESRQIKGVNWQEMLSVEVQVAGVQPLNECIEEKRIDSRQPDISAVMNGMPLAIEVAFTHFCDDEKIAWLEGRNLTTLEIDIFMPPDTPSEDVLGELEKRLFSASPYSKWLHLAGIQNAVGQLDVQEKQVRQKHAKSDAAYEAEQKRKKADDQRKQEFLAKIRDVEEDTFKLDPNLTLRIARSQIRVTMKGHGYFSGVSDGIKQMIRSTAEKFGGVFNQQYTVWEFKPPEDQVELLYKDLYRHISQQLSPVRSAPPASPPRATVSPKPPIHAQLSLSDDELELFEERASHLEFDAGMSRDDAEKHALAEVTRKRARPVAG